MMFKYLKIHENLKYLTFADILIKILKEKYQILLLI